MVHPGAILCEACGYCLHGITTRDNCPECGRPAALSMPERRIGSPWQRSPGVRAFFITLGRTFFRPTALWAEVSVESGRAMSLLFVYLGVATFAWTPIIWSALSDEVGEVIFFAWTAFCVVAAVCATSFAIWLLLSIWGRVRGWRAWAEVVDAVFAHACAGVLLGPVITLLAVMTGNATGAWRVPMSVSTHPVFTVLMYAQVVVPVAFVLSFGFIGLSEMRFANRPRRAKPIAPPEPPPERPAAPSTPTSPDAPPQA